VGLTVVSGDSPSVAGAAGPCFDGDVATGAVMGLMTGAAIGAVPTVGAIGRATCDGACSSRGAKMGGVPGGMGAARGGNGGSGLSLGS
jgi:hypothetical protein